MKSNKKKTILIYGINYYPELTGIGKYNAELATWIQSNTNIQVVALTAFPYYPNWKVFKDYRNRFYVNKNIEEVTVIRCPIYVPNKLSGINRIVHDFSFLFSSFWALLYLRIFHQKFDYILSVAPPFLIGLNSIFYKLTSSKTKVIYHVQDLQIDAADQIGMIKSGLLLKIMYSVERFIIKKVDVVTTISDGMKLKLLQKEQRKVTIFPNWVDSKLVFPVQFPKYPLLEYEDRMENKIVIFYSGAMGEKQGLEILIDIASNLHKNNHKEFIFMLCGEGPYKDILSEKIKSQNIENIIFADLQPINKFNLLLNYAHIHLVLQKKSATDLVLPSKLTNILAVGGVCIVTAEPNTTLYNLIFDNKIGFVVEPENAEAIVDILLDFKISNNSNVQNIKKNAIEYAKTHLNKESIIPSFIDSILEN